VNIHAARERYEKARDEATVATYRVVSNVESYVKAVDAGDDLAASQLLRFVRDALDGQRVAEEAREATFAEWRSAPDAYIASVTARLEVGA
jgi:hypothetical protein